MHNNYISEDAYYNKINKNPVYVVLMNGGTPLSKIISGFTGDTYTHACIAFNAKLKPLYSFGLTSESTFGFAVADTKDRKAFPHIDKYAVYVMYVSNHQLYKMKKRLKWFMGNKDNLKFDFPALVSVFFQKDTENHTDKYFCSRFVSEILKIGEVDLKKKASLYRPESLLELSNISLVNWGRDILHYNWIKTRDNERLIKANKYVNPKNLIPKFESGGNDLYEETHWDTLLTKPKLYFNKKVTMYHYSNTNKDIVIPLTVNAGNKLAKPRFSSWWTPYKSNAGWALSYVIFNTFKESKWKDVLWHVEEMTIDGMTYRAPRTIITESFYKSHEDFIKSIDVYEHQKTFNGSDLGRGNEYSVDEYTCDFAVKPDRVRRISWDEMLEIIKIVPDDEFQLYRKELNDMWVHGKTFQDLVHEKKPWLYWEMDVTKDIRARYCKEHNIQFKIDEEYFRFTYHGGGIYEALKQHISPNVWRRLLTSSNFKWLPKPDYYSDTCTSWFTKEGKDQFVKKVLPICEKYLGDEIEYTKAKDLKNIVYKDRYQVVVDPVTNTNESVVYDDREFYDILEEDSKHDYEKYNYGDKYVKNLRKVDILKSQLKKGKITQEEFDKEYAKLSSVKDEYDDEFTVPRSGTKKVNYNRPNKNKPDDSFKNIDHKGEDRSIYSGKVSDTNGEKFDHYNEILKRTENYNDYKTAFKNLTKLLGKPNACTIKVYHGSKNGKVNCECFDNKKPANCTSDTKLYHTTNVKGLTRLDGKFRGGEGFYFSSKRVYFHKDNPGGRQTNATGNYIPGPGEYVYEFIGNPSQAYVDPELNGTAVFIETDTSVPVKDVTDQFKNKENKENKETKESVIYDDRDFDTILEDSYDIRVRKAMRHKNNTRLFIISKQKLGDTLKPKSYKVNGKQENLCILAHSIQHALMMLGEFCLGKEYFVYQTEDVYDLYNPKDDERIYPKCVSEVWIKTPVKISYMKKIKVTRDMFYPKYRNNPPEDIGSINNPYTWNTIETGVQHDSTWIKESGSTVNKSSNPLLNNIIEFNAKTNVMEYIIPNNGNIITKFDYKAFLTKYRVLSPEKFKKYNGGICWDYVIYESYYFNKNFRNVPYKAFYHSFINDRTDPAHTFILFYLSGKVYWFESSLKDLRGVYEFANESDALSYITRELYHVLDSNTRIRIRDSFLTTYNPVDTTTYNMTMEQYTDYMFTKPKYEYMKKNNPRYIRKYLGTEEFNIDQYHTESKSNKHIYFISDKNMDGKVLSPRIPDNYFTRHGYEDTKTKRVCFTPSIDKSLMALSNNITGKEFYVHVAIGDYKVYKPNVKQVPDSKVTGELWVTKPVKVSCIGKIKVISDMGLSGHKFSYGDKEAELYDWKYEWVERLNSMVESCNTLDIYITESNQKSTVLLDFKKKSGIKFAFIDIHDSRAKKYLDKNSFYKKNFKKIMSITNGEIAVDVDNDKLAGYIYVGAGKKGQDKNYGFIQTLEVLKQYRGYGLSNSLLDDAIKKYNVVDLTVYKDNEVAIKLYKKHGFVIIGYGNSKDKSDYWMKLKTKLTKDEKIMNEAAITEACKNPREARRFVQDVEKLAKKYNANYFLVTDGASGTNNKDNKAVKYCRDALKEWERKNKFNPDEDWRKNPDDFSDYKLEETMLYEFANKELLDKIHVTSDVELSKWMKSNIKYQEFKKLMTPEEVFESRRGSCHDQVVFELAVLKALKYSPKTLFFIEYNDGETVGGQTHSLVYYRRGNNFFWFENAWGDQAGIHGPYKNVTGIKNDIISKHDTKKYKKLQFSSFRGKAGMTLDELVKACLK